MSSLSNKIRIRFTDNVKRSEVEVMRQLNSVTPLCITDCYIAIGSAVVTLATTAEVDSLLTQEAKAQLSTLGLHPVAPSAHLSEKTLFLPKVRDFISNTNTEELAKLINEGNDHRYHVTKVVVVPNSDHKPGMRKNLKVTFNNQDEASHALNNGLDIGDFHIPSRFIYKEDFVSVRQCFRCFSFDHYSNACTAETPACSICAGSHKYLECTDKDKVKCYLCGGKHYAISPSCPRRKEEKKKIKC